MFKFDNPQLIFTFLTPHASDMLETRNVVPYYELPVYRSTNMSDIKGIGMGDVDPLGQLPKGQTLDLQSTNIQLNCVPDKLIIFARRLPSNLTCCDTDSYLTINNISINWNNHAGLLSSFTAEQLYRASIASGLNNLTWDEFQGLATSVAGVGLPVGRVFRRLGTGTVGSVPDLVRMVPVM